MQTELLTSGEDGYGSSVLPLSHLVTGEQRAYGVREGLPTLAYFYPESDEDRIIRFEEEVFRDSRVAIGCRLFNCLRFSTADVPTDAARKEYGGGQVPCFVVLDPEGKELKRLSGFGTTAPRLYSVMSTVLRSCMKVDLGSIVRDEERYLKKLDDLYWKIEDTKIELAALAERDGGSAERQAAKREEELAELEKRYDALKDEEQAFLDKALEAARGS